MMLRDYAEIAAEQYAGGVATALDYGWFFPVLRGMTETGVGLRVPGAEFEIRTQMGSHRMSVLATRFFRARLDSGEVIGAAGWPAPLADAGMRALLQEHAPTAAAEGWPVAAVVHEGGGADRLIVFQAMQQSAPEHLVVKGFDAPLAGFVAVLGPVLSADRVPCIGRAPRHRGPAPIAAAHNRGHAGGRGSDAGWRHLADTAGARARASAGAVRRRGISRAAHAPGADPDVRRDAPTR